MRLSTMIWRFCWHINSNWTEIDKYLFNNKNVKRYVLCNSSLLRRLPFPFCLIPLKSPTTEDSDNVNNIVNVKKYCSVWQQYWWFVRWSYSEPTKGGHFRRRRERAALGFSFFILIMIILYLFDGNPSNFGDNSLYFVNIIVHLFDDKT